LLNDEHPLAHQALSSLHLEKTTTSAGLLIFSPRIVLTSIRHDSPLLRKRSIQDIHLLLFPFTASRTLFPASKRKAACMLKRPRVVSIRGPPHQWQAHGSSPYKISAPTPVVRFLSTIISTPCRAFSLDHPLFLITTFSQGERSHAARFSPQNTLDRPRSCHTLES
jgi:hypothetical protein